MTSNEMVEMLRNLINKIYNETDLNDSILMEVEADLKQIEKVVDGNKAYRELVILIEAAKKEKNPIGRLKFKLAILSGLEREYKSLIAQEVK